MIKASPTQDRMVTGAYQYNGANQDTFPLTGNLADGTIELRRPLK
jgi:hypothetical protein